VSRFANAGWGFQFSGFDLIAAAGIFNRFLVCH
jgi:hypothetical protein